MTGAQIACKAIDDQLSVYNGDDLVCALDVDFIRARASAALACGSGASDERRRAEIMNTTFEQWRVS